MAVPAYDLILPDGRVVQRPQIPEDAIFRAQNPLPGAELVRILATLPYTPISAHGTVFRAACVKAAGGYSDAWGLASDEDLYRRVAEISDVAYCPEPVVVVVARSSERQFSLGSFKGIYTIFEFRKDTARRYWEGRPLTRTWNLGRLSILKAVALVREMLYRWLFGTPAEVEMALTWDGMAIVAFEASRLVSSGGRGAESPGQDPYGGAWPWPATGPSAPSASRQERLSTAAISRAQVFVEGVWTNVVPGAPPETPCPIRHPFACWDWPARRVCLTDLQLVRPVGCVALARDPAADHSSSRGAQTGIPSGPRAGGSARLYLFRVPQFTHGVVVPAVGAVFAWPGGNQHGGLARGAR